ncbi:MAG: DUF4124 domain-containing protein [Alteromonadaceae bacterium]|nr:DUF4124 domain-containing protein [Alteromonadaceae bacterium]
MMMKWLIRLAFPALALLLLLIFFGLGDPDQVTEPDTMLEPREIPDFEGLLPSPIETDGPDIVFKWQDTEGNWHYADKPPAQGPWNALAIDRHYTGAPDNLPKAPEEDWQSPYRAPFSLDEQPAANDS